VTRFRPGRRLRRALDPGDPFGEAHLRVVNAAVRLRLVVGLLAAGLLFFTPGHSLDERLVVAGLVAGWALLVAVIDKFADRHLKPSRVIDTVLGAVAVLVVTLVVPGLFPATLLALMAAVVVDTCLAGLRGGIEALVLSLAIVVTLQWSVEPRYQMTNITLVLFAAFLIAVVLVVDTMTSERRRAAGDLERVQRGLRSMTTAPGLEATLDSVVHSVVDVVDSTFAVILLHDDDRLVPAASSPVTEGWPTGDELAAGVDSPVTDALRRGASVVVDDIAAAARYPTWSARWAGRMKALGITSLVTVPLRADREVIGALVACFDGAVGTGDAELGLLEAYADQAALVIVRAQAYEEERLAAAELAAADRLKSEFLATVSHELRTPLTATKGFVDTVLLHWDRLSDAQRRQMLARASANAEDLTRQIEQLLDLSRIEAGKVDAALEEAELLPLARDVVGRLAPLLVERRVLLDVPVGMRGLVDRNSLAHVLENLLANAVKFSDPGSTVTIVATARGEEAVVSVVDEGIGIAAVDRDRIFERFEQVVGTERPRRGAGIGLAIVRSLVELQGGRVWVESTPGRGSAFCFTLGLVAAGAGSGAELAS
jgi:signal transduction histidine kinase